MSKSLQQSGTMLVGKRIIFVLFSFEIGGAERQALYLAHYLQTTCKAYVEVWAFCNPGRLIEMCEEYGIKWRLIPLKIAFDNKQVIINTIYLGMKLWLARRDILMPYMTAANIYCGLIWRLTGARVCVWNQRNAGIERLNPFFEKMAAKNASVLVSNSQQGADFLISTYQVRSQNVYVIHNGVKFDLAGNEMRDTTDGGEQSEIVACMVANLHPGKDHETLIRAWALAVKQINRPARLLIAGRFDSTFDQLQELVKELGVEHTVTFLGSVKDIPNLLFSTDLGILLSPFSNYEGIPNTILEYMLAGLPVIGTDIPGIREALGRQNYEFLAPIGASDKIAQLIIRLANDRDLRRTVGSKNIERAMTNFSLEKMCNASINIIINGISLGKKGY